MIRVFLTALIAASPAAAQTPLTGEEFEAIVAGKTIHYRQSGERAGSEQYLANRRVRWQLPDGSCDDGHWYTQEASICFVYEGFPEEPQCWTFFNEQGMLTGFFDPEPDDPPLTGSRITSVPLSCVGPDLGA